MLLVFVQISYVGKQVGVLKGDTSRVVRGDFLVFLCCKNEFLIQYGYVGSKGLCLEFEDFPVS